jgi:sulfofructosephosphate aldolase
VKISCENGASGFLAGRAIWADAASKAAPRDDLRRESVPRMQNLVSIVQTARGAKAA